MATKENNCYSSKCLVNNTETYILYLYKGFSLMQGYGLFCIYYYKNSEEIGFGFHKTNKFTAVRQALIKNL